MFGSPQYPDWAAVLEFLFREKLLSEDPSLLHEYDSGRRANIEEYPEDAREVIAELRTRKTEGML